jgi:ATP-binding cassette, subfamily B, bacterial
MRELDCVQFCLPLDLNLEGEATEGWLVITDRAVLSYAVDKEVPTLIAGPVDLKVADKARLLQTIGSAFVQMRVDGVYVNLARLSNGLRELHGRGVNQMKRLIAGDAFQPDALTEKSQTICSDCAMPLPAAKAPCPRCTKKGSIFTRTFGLMRPYFGGILLLLGVMVVGVLLNLVPPMLMRKLVDEVLTPRTNFEWLPWILGGLVAAATLRSALDIVIGRTSSFIGTKITKDLRERVQSKLMGLSVDYYNRNSAGSLMSRVLNDVDCTRLPAQCAHGAGHRLHALRDELAARAVGARAHPVRVLGHRHLLALHLPALLPRVG